MSNDNSSFGFRSLRFKSQKGSGLEPYTGLRGKGNIQKRKIIFLFWGFGQIEVTL